MTPEALFDLSGPLAMSGWLILLLSPFAPRASDIVAGYVIPGVFSAAYVALILVHWSGADGGYDSLSNVMALFDSPGVALAGWVHYLAFDLFVGAWIVRRARAEGMAFALVLPCLPLTFLFGPAGLFAYFALRAATHSRLQEI